MAWFVAPSKITLSTLFVAIEAAGGVIWLIFWLLSIFAVGGSNCGSWRRFSVENFSVLVRTICLSLYLCYLDG